MAATIQASSSAAPPLLRGLPLLGNTVDALRDVCGLLEQGYHTHGPVFRLRRLGREAVVLAGIEANEFFLANDSALFYSRDVYHHLAKEGGADHTFIALDGAPHRHLRDELRLGYSRQLVASVIPELVAQVQAQARAWPAGQTFDVLTMMANLLVDQAGRALLSHTLTADDFAPLLTFCKTFVGVGVDIQPPILLRRPAYQRAKRHFFAMMEGVFAAHCPAGAETGRSHDQIDLARRAHYADGTPLSETDVRANTYYTYVMNAVYTNRLCANMLYALLKDPLLLARVQAEVDAVCEAGPVDLLALRRMPVLRATMREALRLYPIVAGIPRHVKQDFEFGGYRIRAGQKVYIAASVTHVLPEIFPNPHQFDADRFLPPRDEHHQPRAYLPFGAGAHACMGASLATLFTLTTMVGVLRAARFQIDPASYVVRRVADPMPGPNGFRVRVLPFTPRAASAPASVLAPADEDLALRDAPSLDRAEQDQLLASAQPQVFAAGSTIIRQGDPADAFYILSRGSVEVLREQPGAPAEPLARLTDGAFFGEIGLLQNRPRTATVRVCADAPAELLVLPREAFLRYVARFDLVSDEIAALIRRRAISRGLADSLLALTPAQIAAVAPEVAQRSYQAGQEIIRQGDPAETFYILTRGRAEVLRHYPIGQAVTIDWREPGEYFGEIGLLQNRPRTATVRAGAGGAEVLELGRAAFLRLVSASAATEGAIAREMARRLTTLAR